MINLRKSAEKVRLAMVTTAMVLGAIACNRSASESGPKIDMGDAKVAADKIAEAEALYDGREDLSKARVAVAALRQARTADYGNYEASWKLARASFYVAEHT